MTKDFLNLSRGIYYIVRDAAAFVDDVTLLLLVNWLNYTGHRAKYWQMMMVGFYVYSYARVSLTVNFDALPAGIALATAARMSIKISHAMIPLAP